MEAALALWTPAPAGAAPWAIVAGLAALAIMAASARLVPIGQWIVVLRFGRAVRVAASGLAFHIPGMERQVLLTRTAVQVPLVAWGRSVDGAEVRLAAHATLRIVDPGLAAQSSAEPLQVAADDLELALAGLVHRSDLASLAALRSGHRAYFA